MFIIDPAHNPDQVYNYQMRNRGISISKVIGTAILGRHCAKVLTNAEEAGKDKEY